jgi:hypothetical protein
MNPRRFESISHIGFERIQGHFSGNHGQRKPGATAGRVLQICLEQLNALAAGPGEVNLMVWPRLRGAGHPDDGS